MSDREKLEAALHEADVYGIGATSDTNQQVILQAARAHAALMREPIIRCTRCNEVLTEGRIVWLNLNCRTGRYTVEPVEIEAEDQGAHPFGRACSRRALKGDTR